MALWRNFSPRKALAAQDCGNFAKSVPLSLPPHKVGSCRSRREPRGAPEEALVRWSDARGREAGAGLARLHASLLCTRSSPRTAPRACGPAGMRHAGEA